MRGISGLAARFNLPIADSFTGIAIGGGALYLADLKRTGEGGFRLNCAADAPLDGHNPFTPDVGRQLARLAREHKLRKRSASILAAGRGLRVKILEMPRMARDELVASLRFTEAETSPYSLEDAGLDGCILSGGMDGRMPVLMASLEEREMARYHQLFCSSPFRPAALTVVPAVLEALLEYSRVIDAGVPVAFVNISNAAAGIYIFENKSLRFARDIAFGGDAFIEALAGEYGEAGVKTAVSRDEAQSIAAFFGVPRDENSVLYGPHGVSGEAVLARLQPSLDRLVMELGRSLDYYRNEFQRGWAPALHLIGSAARMKNLAGYLADALGCRVAVYSPFEDFIAADGPSHAAARENGPAYAVAVGAALDRGKRINLLPEKLRASARNRLRARLPAVAVALYVVLVAALVLGGMAYRAALDAQITFMEKKISGPKKVYEAGLAVQSAVNRVRDEIQRIDSHKAAFPRLEGRDMDWQALYAEVGRLMPADMALDRLSFRFGGQKKYAADGARYGRQALFEGRIRGGPEEQVKTLKRFLGMMRDSTVFKKAELISTRAVDEGGHSYLKVTLEADIGGGTK